MPTCPKCGMNFSYSDTHVCEGRDYTKVWFMVFVACGALAGGPLGLWYGRTIIGRACEKPNASNLCGFVPSYFVPGYVVIGAVIGALIATVAVIQFMGRSKA